MTKLSWMLVLALAFWQHPVHGIPMFERDVYCGPKLSEYPCIHGTLTINMNRTACDDRIVCKRNLGETCQMYGDVSNCMDGLVCSCDKCREMLTICVQKVKSPMNMPKRMKPIFPEYAF